MPKNSEAKEFNPVNLNGILNELEKVVKIQSITLSGEDRLSTGLLSLDLVLGGGITAGMYTFTGAEQSAKTTLALTVLGSTVKQNVQLRTLWDAENSSGSSMDYVENIFQAQGVNADFEELFGSKQKGKYVKSPLIYYRDEGEMDTFFNWFSGLLRRLPDKRYEADRWWYVYEANAENKSKYKGMFDRNLSSANGALYIPAASGALQAVVLIDSYPSLLPAALDDDDPKNSMALQAREFSRHLPRVKGRLRSKRVALLGINQLRTAPMVMFRDPLYEPGGEALKFNSDARLRSTARALSGVPFNPKGKGQIEKEPSVQAEGEDTYRYIHIKAIKNKLSVPGRETWQRLWVEAADGKAYGFDPVWDTFFAMSQTGQISGKRSSMLLNVHGLGKAKKAIDWQQFKTLILGSKEEQLPIFKKMGLKAVNLRKGMFMLSRKGILEELYVENHRAKLAKKRAEENDEVEEDEDEEA